MSIEERISWTTRLNIRPSAKDALRRAAKADGRSVASAIGIAIEEAVKPFMVTLASSQ